MLILALAFCAVLLALYSRNVKEKEMIRLLYMFFVGIFIALFIGVGVSLFYPPPTAPEPVPYYGKELTDSEKAEEEAYIKNQESYEHSMHAYNRDVSIIVLVCAVAVMTISFLLPMRFDVIIQGVMLGSVFSLFYSIIRGMESDSNGYRFFIASIGLAISIVLGYLKFVDDKTTDVHEPITPPHKPAHS